VLEPVEGLQWNVGGTVDRQISVDGRAPGWEVVRDAIRLSDAPGWRAVRDDSSNQLHL
jgi:hypothetical protein